MPNELALIKTYDEAERAANAMFKSGLFQDVKQVGQALVKILAGQELGFGPYASMSGVNIIQGKTTMGANLMAAAIKRTNKYNYRITEMSDQACEITFYENGQQVGKSRFSIDDAKKANLTGKDNWVKYPRNMLFARAISNGQRWYAPDVFNGALVYTPDELGAVTDEDGNVIDAVVTEVKQSEKTTPVHDQPESKSAQPEAIGPLFDGIPDELAQYMNVLADDGTPYPMLQLKELTVRYNSLDKALKANGLTDEQRKEKTRKHAAADAIIRYYRAHTNHAA